MSVLLSTYATGRDNNLNLIRFLAASLVLVSHCYYPLAIGQADQEPLKIALGMAGGEIAVDIFFIMSGFLITGSYFSRGNILAFAWSRILRIYPALIIAVTFCVFIIGLFFTTHTPSEYFTDFRTRQYFIKNIILFFGVEHHLPGVFSDISDKGAVNGSLWTLPYEVKMYTILAITLAILTFVERRLESSITKGTLIILAIGAISAHIANYFFSLAPIHFIRLFTMFFVGATFYMWRDRIYLSSKFFWLTIILLIISTVYLDLFFIVYNIVLPYVIFYLAYVPKGIIRKFNDFGDYSYGIYIYAFPVQQSVAALIPGISLLGMILVSFVSTFFFAFLSWHCIEKRFLKMKDVYFLRP